MDQPVQHLDPKRTRRPSMRLALLALVVLAVSTLACSDGSTPTGDGTALEGKLVLTGSSTVAPVAGEIARRFETLYPETRIDVQTGGSSRGIADARAGVADIGMASRALATDEGDLVAHTIAHDGICLVVHQDNPVESLDDDQVRAIYRGEITDWSEVGGAAGPITVVTKAAGRATLEVFLDYFDLDAMAVDADVVIGDNQQGLKTVAGAPGAIAFISIGAADYESRHGAPIKLLAAGSIAPTTGNVAAGLFPITRPLNLLTAERPLDPLEQAFLEFSLSDDVHDLIEAQFFVPATLPETRANLDATAPQG